jgi:phospholipid transport system substrate-binding protein
MTATLRPLALALALTLGAGLPASEAAAQAAAATAPATSPSAVVQATTERVLGTLQSRREEFRASPEALQAFVTGELERVFDNVYSARLVLGRHGRGADEAELRAFADALAGNLMRRYGTALVDVDADVNIAVDGETALRGGRIMQVKTRVLRRSGSPVPVDYYLHQAGGEWKVFDVAVEGISYVQTFRTQFDEALRTRTLAQVTEDLRAGRLQPAGE